MKTTDDDVLQETERVLHEAGLDASVGVRAHDAYECGTYQSSIGTWRTSAPLPSVISDADLPAAIAQDMARNATTRAGALEAVIYAAQIGILTADEARELLSQPDDEPISVGDWVRWEREPCGDRPAAWIEGEVLHVSEAIGDDRTYRIGVVRSQGFRIGGQPVVGVHCAKVTRIERRSGESWTASAGPHDPVEASRDTISDQWRAFYKEAMAASVEEIREHLKGSGWSVAWDDEPVDPLDAEYDGVTLRHLLASDETHRHERNEPAYRLTAVQRAAISAHWSAELRAKVEASKAKERERVVLDLNAEDL